MAEAMNDGGGVDPTAWERLRHIGGDQFFGEMIGVFLTHAPKLLGEARAALAAGNLEPVERAGHSLKSSCGNVGAPRMRAAALALEEAARQQDQARLPELMAALERAFAEIQPAFAAARRAAPK